MGTKAGRVWGGVPVVQYSHLVHAGHGVLRRAGLLRVVLMGHVLARVGGERQTPEGGPYYPLRSDLASAISRTALDAPRSITIWAPTWTARRG